MQYGCEVMHASRGRDTAARSSKRRRHPRSTESEVIAVEVGLPARGEATWWLDQEQALEVRPSSCTVADHVYEPDVDSRAPSVKIDYFGTRVFALLIQSSK